jgi:hypothetical protein
MASRWSGGAGGIMRRIGWRLLVVVIVACSSSVLVNATDPPFDVGVCKIEGAPGCDTLDGAIIVGNQSTTYYYKVNLAINCGPIRCTATQCGRGGTMSDAVLSPRFCTPGQNPPCFQQIACLLRNCPWSQPVCDSCQTCDNDPADCNTDDELCTDVSGGVTAIAWSTDNVNWTNFEDPPTIGPTEYCAGGNSCE